MYKRPKPGEDEDDILQMQKEFFDEKNSNKSLQPAAQFVNLRAELQPSKRSNTSDQGERKLSKYAQSRKLGNHSEKKARIESGTGSIMGDILEKNIEQLQESKEKEDEDDKVYYPKVIPSVLGEIVEKNVDHFHLNMPMPMPVEGFPIVIKYDPSIQASEKSIHAQHLEKVKESMTTQMEIDIPSTSNASQMPTDQEVNKQLINLPSKSYILTSEEADEIHNGNVNIISKMSEKEILDEQQKLLSSLDPTLIEFIKARRLQPITPKTYNIFKQSKNVSEKMDTSEAEQSELFDNDSLWANDILSHPQVDQWLHFDSLEKDKLEWMKGIEQSRIMKNEEPYEARFDLKGYLLPYTMEYTENTKTLFHHGEEPHRPGYTLTELFELSRSNIIQQRVMALNTIAGVLDYYNAGTYKDVLEIPLSKIFFVIRFTMDENKVIILEPALKAMRNLIYNRVDEASLDALLGFEEGTQQPCLENDKSEIEELESQESELKDFHLAEIDIIAALLRTDILQRLYYILDSVKPGFNSIQYSLQILTRLSRDSIETTNKIVKTDHLMKTIIKNFVPIASINFRFEPQIAYSGKPVLAALKLIRVLSLQSREIGDILIKRYDILKPISEYISSGVDGTYGLRIQIEAFCIISNFIHYNLGTENATSLLPIVVTTLYKHVQGTNVYVNASIISATHAAVVLQFINKLLSCNFINIDNFKQQIYPLIKEGAQKWLTQLSHSQNYTCGHLRVLCSALDCCKTILLIEKVEIKFLNDSLKALSLSQGYRELVKHLIPSSNLLSDIENKDLHLVKNLKSLGGSVIDSPQKVLPLLNVVCPLPFLTSLFKLLEIINNERITGSFVEQVMEYLRKLAKKVPSLCDNWFTRIETDFVFSIIKVSVQGNVSESKKDFLYAVANKLCYILRSDKKQELEYLFSNIVFNKYWFTAERLMHLVSLSETDGFSKALNSIEDIKKCYSKVINLNYNNTGPNIVLRKWQEPILPRDWIYLPILNLYSKNQEVDATPKIIGQHANKVASQIAAEKEIVISCSLEWILFNESCFSDLLNDIDITDRFCRIMCVFLCDNSLFLDSNIKNLLYKCTQNLFKKEKKKHFNFDKQLIGLNNFQDFYTQFLEQFQAVSYGDHNFAACVLVPLAQRHNVKWRKLLWSEYAGCLRALDCPEDMLCYNIKEYFNPLETDESLIKSYFQALSTNLLRPNTIVHRIASHHVEHLKSNA